VTNIGRGAFASCGGLSAITIGAPNSFYSSVAGVLFNADQTTLIQCPGGKTGNYTVPSGVTTIGEISFLGCFYLAGVTIPSTVTNIGMAAFTDCYSLASVTLFDGITRIPEFVFGYCRSLTRVTIPNSVTSIGGFAFQHCDSLASITIPGSVTFLEGYVFDWCHSLKGVYFLGNAPPEYYNFRGATNATVYYLPATTGWGPIYDGRPAVLWNPQVPATDRSFGLGTNGFGFTITGASNLVLVVEASTNLATPLWFPVSTNTLAGGSSYFSDPRWTNYSGRFYRLRSP